MQALEIAGKDVDLQIDAIAAAQATQRGDVRCVRDQVQVEIARAIGMVVERIDGERYAIPADQLPLPRRALLAQEQPRELVEHELQGVGRGPYRLEHAFLFVALGLPAYAYELMPIAAFPGRHGWGYDGAYISAIQVPMEGFAGPW